MNIIEEQFPTLSSKLVLVLATLSVVPLVYVYFYEMKVTSFPCYCAGNGPIAAENGNENGPAVAENGAPVPDQAYVPSATEKPTDPVQFALGLGSVFLIIAIARSLQETVQTGQFQAPQFSAFD